VIVCHCRNDFAVDTKNKTHMKNQEQRLAYLCEDMEAPLKIALRYAPGRKEVSWLCNSALASSFIC
jgi:hypothetical protein